MSETTDTVGIGERVSTEELLHDSPVYKAVPTSLRPDTELSYVVLDLDLNELTSEMHKQIRWFGDDPEDIERLIDLYNLDHVPNYASNLVETAALLTRGNVTSVADAPLAGHNECIASIHLLYLGMLEMDTVYGGGVSLYSVGKQTVSEFLDFSDRGELPGLVQVYSGVVPYISSDRLVLPTFDMYLEEADQYSGIGAG